MNTQKQYLENQVKSATPGELIVMLYDGLIRNIDEAHYLLEKEDEQSRSRTAELITKALNILAELSNSLNEEQYPELANQLQGLYEFFTLRLSQGLKERKPEQLAEILPLIEELRGTWHEANDSMALENEEVSSPN